MGYQDRQEKLRKEREERAKAADKKFSATALANRLVHQQGNSQREKFLKDSVSKEVRKQERALVSAEIDRDYSDASKSYREDKKKFSAASDSLNRKMRDDTRNASLLDKQPGKSKREEFLRDSVSKEYNKTASENMRNIARSSAADAEVTAVRNRRDLSKMKARGDTANQSGDYHSVYSEHNDVPLRKRKKK